MVFIICRLSILLYAFFPLPSGAAIEDAFEVWIGQEGWHTGVIVKTGDIPAHIWPEAVHYSQFKWLDVSWGDMDYYTAPKGTIPLALKAALLPTRSVLLIIPFNSSPAVVYGEGSTMVRIRMNKAHFYELCRFISTSFQRRNGAVIPHEKKGFFLAQRKYHLFRTCNTWTALALKKAGYRIRTFPVITAAQLFNQTERIEKAELVVTSNQ